MSLTITKADVKRKCMIDAADTTWDAPIESLIDEMQPAIEYTLDESALNDPEAGLQALLQLGVLELIVAEFLAQRFREAGYAEEFQVGAIRIGQLWERGKAIFEQGAARLAPFRKAMGVSDAQTKVLSSSVSHPRLMSSTERKGW
ncbi:MAG: hypothetical protein IT209_03160 [Armatimonadetes bacterium]|nr:hypothetical protein [Armatimonadota bacterium]